MEGVVMKSELAMICYKTRFEVQALLTYESDT